MEPLKPRDKVTQHMTRDGLTLDNQTTGESVNVSSREAEQEYTAQPEGAAEKILERADELHDRHKAKKAAKDAGETVVRATGPVSRLQFTAEERASPELAPYIKKAEKRADQLEAAKEALPKKRVVTKETVYDERRGKQLLPTKDGHNLACVLPEVLTSPQITAQWETELTAIAKGQADPEGFMAGIAEMTRGLIANYSQISEDAQKLFQTERVVIGKCPRCGESVYEGKKNYYCGNRSCQFVMWKNDRFFEERGKAFTPKIAAALLKDGKANDWRTTEGGKRNEAANFLRAGTVALVCDRGGSRRCSAGRGKCLAIL